MPRIDVARERLSIDVFPEEHRQIKSFAALHGETIREYVLECIRERLRKETEKKDLTVLAMRLDQDPLFKQAWDNKKDAAYDKL
ncbi:MAG: hypothetical protein A3I73_02975 [Omnitrophica bacterium RIFCSPLOWO2_02_FULL_45_16]|nr:MAG: hypothetical protein A3C51_06270 [Omnitrophica bacterium RIFCSPHIGHO2_02_FULL_46_20]OGW94027.1 MAG: hypothetical protein A3K16_04735 [Omnitrophica bacterium RIFCSPLOWO2_01_FULL_45_24]OGW94584.1 MAG: hypothetical protein A3G36_06515 [Omnitrophica bacterium RIFCSPLOWO2_12_FULL_45_13]OGX00977.1 MAG: hypothetical protein A3I73_02975 [Omnitrophica bacterium RIFCSPLOWO2_02_FULL_45_16]